MKRARADLLCAILFALSLPACERGTEPSAFDFERMRQQQRVGPYDASDFFADGMSMRVPPAGTVAREHAALGSAGITGMSGGAYVASPPIAIPPDAMRAGQRDFVTWCGACHGADGKGGTRVARNLPVPPPSLVGAAARALPAGEIFAIVTHGRGRMPPYDWALPPAARWHVVAYLQHLQGGGE